MAMAMSCVAFAADDVQTLAHSGTDEGAITGSITIDNAAKGETCSIYQIFEMTYVDFTKEETEPGSGIYTESDSYSYKVCDEWVNWIQTQTDLFTLEMGTDGNYYVTAKSGIFSATDEEVAQFARDALDYAATNEIEATASITAGYGENSGSSNDDGTYTIKFSSLNLGYYLVDSGLGSLCALDSTDADITIL